MGRLKIYIRETLPERLFEWRLILRARCLALISLWIPTRKNVGVLIGPANSANQASAWAKAFNNLSSGVGALRKSHSLRISANPSQEWFTADYEVSSQERNDVEARVSLLQEAVFSKRIVLIESLRPIFAFRKGRQGFAPRHSIDDAVLMQRMGKKVGVIFHGSDIRDPLAHAIRNPYSPFHEVESKDKRARSSESPAIDMSKESAESLQLREEARELQKSSEINRGLIPQLRAKKIPFFITTPDLFLEVPDAHWLPAVIELEKFKVVAENYPILRDDKLRVLYIPSRSWMKSSDLIVPVLEKLAGEGLIEFKNWVENGAVKHEQIPEILASSDLVIDQFIGLFGVFALEAIASGRIVMTFIDDDHAHHATPPHINITPETLEAEIRRVAALRERSMIRVQHLVMEEGVPTLEFHELPVSDAISAGKDFVHHYHDGTYSVQVLQEVFGLRIE